MKKILIIEDEKEIAQLYAKRLTDKGYDPLLAHDGHEGLEKLKYFSPDLILLDVNMPKMGGLEFYQHICDPRGNPKYPVLVLTGRAELETLFKDFHVAGILIKPFEGERLLKEVDIILDKAIPAVRNLSSRRVIIVDDDQRAADKILAEFTKAGIKAELAGNGFQAIEKMMADPPDLALVKLGLSDLSGTPLADEHVASGRQDGGLWRLEHAFAI
jgi:DNA-binding response OmpR family regulator